MSDVRAIARCLLVAGAALGAGCSWVEPTAAGKAVRVAWEGDVAGCRDVGTIEVAVLDKIGFWQRGELKVRDELETLARNRAASLPADTIRPTSEPKDGAQSFEAYVCGDVRVRERDLSAPRKEQAETFPAKDH